MIMVGTTQGATEKVSILVTPPLKVPNRRRGPLLGTAVEG